MNQITEGSNIKSNLNKGIGSNNQVIKIQTETSPLDFIKFGKIKLNFAEIKVRDPFMIFFEFDEFQPWLIE